MTLHLGEVPSGSTLYIPFATYGGTSGQSITLTGLAVTDIEIYKNGSATQRASDAGYALLDTDGIDFDGITGIHGFSVDLSDNTDSGFYSVGGFYWVVVSAVTVDSQTVSFIAATFWIGAARDTTGYPKVTVKSGTGTGELSLSSGTVTLTDGSLTAAKIAADAITAAKVASDVSAEIADAVWDEARSGHTTDGTFGGDAVDSDTFAADIADAVWDEVQSGHTTAGTFGKYLDSAISGVSTGGVTAADIADAVLDEALSGHTTAGTLGKAVSDILTDTGTDIPATLTTLTGYVDTEVAAIKAKTDNLPASPAATGDIPTATENADALLKRDMSAVTGESARSPLNALRALRNKVSRVGTTLTVTKEDDSTSAWTATLTTDAAAEPVTSQDPA